MILFRRSSSFFIGLLIPLLVLALAPSASAHTSSTYYTGAGGVWPDFHLVGFLVRNGFPSGYATQINNGYSQWNNAENTGRAVDFSNSGATSVTGNADSPCSATYNGIYWRNLDYLGTGVLGFTPHCENSSGVVTRFSMSLDSNAPWYVGTGDAPSGRVDLWSVTTHEFGHATGWVGHFSEGDAVCPDDSTRATMCPGIYPGTERQRTVSTHDVHTFVGAY
jgi:hypothetical protein